MIYQQFSIVFDTPVEKMGICIVDDVISEIAWLPENISLHDSKLKFANQVRSDILYYLDAGKPLPILPMKLNGTEFQLKVWKDLQKIRMGSVITYGQLAKKINTSSRAIGQACRSNPVVLFIPCHRVVSATDIGGYMGKQNRISIKAWLLDHEKEYA